MNDIVKRIDQTTIITQPIFFVLITLTNALNIRILRSPTLRCSSCTCYFLFYSIFSLINIWCLCPIQILRHFSILWTRTRFGCKMQDFLLFSLAIQIKALLALASFDRFCSSAKSARLRSFSRIRIARKVIVCLTVFTLIYMLPMLITQYFDSKLARCRQYYDRWSMLYSISQIILYYVLIPSLMLLFGTLTILNIRQKSVLASATTVQNRMRRNEKQLVRMLLFQVAAHLIYTLPFGISHLIRALEYPVRYEIVLAINQASIPWLQCDYFMFFFLYILSAPTYRQELYRVLRITNPRNEPTEQSTALQKRWISWRKTDVSKLDSRLMKMNQTAV